MEEVEIVEVEKQYNQAYYGLSCVLYWLKYEVAANVAFDLSSWDTCPFGAYATYECYPEERDVYTTWQETFGKEYTIAGSPFGTADSCGLNPYFKQSVVTRDEMIEAIRCEQMKVGKRK